MSSTLLPENFLQKVSISSKILRAVDHRFRQRMLELMELYGSLNAEALSGLLKVEPSLVATHLDILRREKIVDFNLEGKQFFYSVNRKRIAQIDAFIRRLNGFNN